VVLAGFQKRTPLHAGLICLIAVVLGFGGMGLCLRKDGTLVLNLLYYRCHGCHVQDCGKPTSLTAYCQESGSGALPACERGMGCAKIPVFMNASTRTAFRSQCCSPPGPESLFPIGKTNLFVVRIVGADVGAAGGLRKSNPPLESLRSIVLLI
jgi:hypothetical protein